MKRLLWLFPLVFALSQTRAEEVSVSASMEYGSQYVFRGIERGEDTLHPSLELSSGDLYAGVWAALPQEGKDGPRSYDDEYDLYAGKVWVLDEKSYLDLGATYYHFPGGGDGSLEAYFGVVSERGTVTPSLYIFNDFDRETTSLEIATDLSLPMERFPYEARIYGGRVESTHRADYLYYGVDLRYPFELSDRARAALGLHYSGNDLGLGEEDEQLYGSVSVLLRF